MYQYPTCQTSFVAAAYWHWFTVWSSNNLSWAVRASSPESMTWFLFQSGIHGCRIHHSVFKPWRQADCPAPQQQSSPSAWTSNRRPAPPGYLVVWSMTSLGRQHLVLGWGRETLGLLSDYSVEAPVSVFLQSIQILLVVLQGVGHYYADMCCCLSIFWCVLSFKKCLFNLYSHKSPASDLTYSISVSHSIYPGRLLHY